MKIFTYLLSSLAGVAMMFAGIVNAQTAYVPCLGDNSVYVIDVATRSVIDTIAVGFGPRAVAVSPNDSMVFIANSDDQTVSIIDATNNTVVATVPTNGGLPVGLAVSPDNRFVYVADELTDDIAVIEVDSQKVIANVAVGIEPVGVVVSPNGDTVYSSIVTDASTLDGAISVVNVATLTETDEYLAGAATNPLGLVISPDGKTLYIANEGTNDVYVMTTFDGNITAEIPVGDSPVGIAISPTGDLIYVGDEASNDVKVIDPVTNAVTGSIMVGLMPIGISFTPDGLEAYVADAGGSEVVVIDVPTGMIVDTIEVGQAPLPFGNFISGSSLFTSIKKPVTPTFFTYPNPVVNELTVELGTIEAQESTYRITSVVGQEIMRGPIAPGQEVLVLDMSEVARGTYFLSILTENGVQTQSIRRQ